MITSLLTYKEGKSYSLKVEKSQYEGLNGMCPPVKIISPIKSKKKAVILYPGASPDAEEHPKLEMLGIVLAENGFQSGDIYEVLASNMPLVKSYNQAGKKEIPNTMEIKFDPTSMDINKSYLYLFSQRINNGGKLIAEEWAKFCGIGLNFEPSSADSELLKSVAFDDKGNLKPLVRFYELEAKFYSKNISKEELDEFNTFLKKRRTFRLGGRSSPTPSHM